MRLASVTQVADLLSRIGNTSYARFQRLLNNYRVVEQIMNNHVSPAELRRLAEDRYVPLSDYIDLSDLRWYILVETLESCGVSWSQISVKEAGGTYASYPPTKDPSGPNEMIEFLGQDPDKWLVHLPAAF